MSPELLKIFWPYGIFTILLALTGLYCLLGTLNLVRALIGVELLIKAVTVLIITCGYVTGRTALAQALAITFIVIEVVIMTVALGLVIGIQGYNKTLDTRELKSSK
jgi:multisubunit Na+/H+ antiporter MnhC subunit